MASDFQGDLINDHKYFPFHSIVKYTPASLTIKYVALQIAVLSFCGFVRLHLMMFKLQKVDKFGPTVPPEVFNWRLGCLAIVASGGAVIFGYDLSFISGVFSLPSFLRQFNLDAASASHLQTNVVATFQGGAFFGVIFMYYFNEKYGRRLALIIAGLIFNVGVILQIASGGHVPTFYVGRIFSGMGVGGSTFAVPQYLSENSPASARGVLIGAFEIGIQIGSVTGFWTNYGVNAHISPLRNAQWMIPIGVQFIPVIFMMIGLLFLNESPRWLYVKGRAAESAKALSWLRNLPESHPYVQSELQDYERQREHEEDITSGAGFLIIAKETFSKHVRFRLFIGCMLQLFLNSTGVNAFNNFAVSFFEALGFTGTSVKLLASGIYGVVKGVIATLTFIFLIDRFGRRKLLFVGTVGIAFSMFYLAAFSSITDSFHSKSSPNSASLSAVAFIYIYGASYSIGWNIPWIIAAEIYPTRVRSFCMAITTGVHWIGEFYTSYSVAAMIKNITYGIFLFYGVMTVLGGVFVYFFLPETNGLVLEDMDPLFEAKGFARTQMKVFEEMRRRDRGAVVGGGGGGEVDGESEGKESREVREEEVV